MSLTIRDEETCRLARELAELTGKTPTDAIAEALRARLERQREVGERVEQLLAIGRDVREALRKEGRPLGEGEAPSLAVEAMLYDERGLPK